MDDSLKLYVWEGEQNYSREELGGVCVLAHSEEEAWELIAAKDPLAAAKLNDAEEDERGEHKIDPLRETRQRPRIVETPEAFVYWV